MTYGSNNAITESTTYEVHRAVIQKLLEVSFEHENLTVKVPVRFLAANPQLKNTDSSFSDYNSAPRYPSITVFAYQPNELSSTHIGTIKEIEETEGEPGHYDVITYPIPTKYRFRYQLNIASDRQDYLDIMSMKVKNLLWKFGGDKALEINGISYEATCRSLATRVFPNEGVQVEDLEWTLDVPVLFANRAERLPMIEEVILRTGIPEWYEELEDITDFEEVGL